MHAKILLKVKHVQKTLSKRVKCKRRQREDKIYEKNNLWRKDIWEKGINEGKNVCNKIILWQESRFKKASMKKKHK